MEAPFLTEFFRRDAEGEQNTRVEGKERLMMEQDNRSSALRSTSLAVGQKSQSTHGGGLLRSGTIQPAAIRLGVLGGRGMETGKEKEDGGTGEKKVSRSLKILSENL